MIFIRSIFERVFCFVSGGVSILPFLRNLSFFLNFIGEIIAILSVFFRVRFESVFEGFEMGRKISIFLIFTSTVLLPYNFYITKYFLIFLKKEKNMRFLTTASLTVLPELLTIALNARADSQ